MRVLLVLAAAAALLLLIVLTQQRRLIYFPFGAADLRDARLPEASAVSFRTADGVTLGGWFVPARGSSSAPTVIVFNGNAGNRLFRAPLAAALSRRGFPVFLFDYRGYGGNEGRPSEAGLQLDARAAHAHVIARPDVDPRRVVYFGESLGAAVAADLALLHPPAALVLRSPFSSLAAVARFHYPIVPVRWLLRERYATVDRIAALRAPLLVIAGDADRIVPASQSLEVYVRAPEPKSLLIIEGADHNDAALTDGDRMVDGILQFLRTIPGIFD